MRQLMRVAAVVAGYAAAYFGGDLLVPLLRSSLADARYRHFGARRDHSRR